jgi:Domain of unknown function (DUF4403)
VLFQPALDRLIRHLAAAVLLATLASCAAGPGLQPPPRDSLAPTPAQPAPESVVTLGAAIPFNQLQQAVATHMPPAIPVSGRGSLMCAPVPTATGGRIENRETCVNTPYCDAKGCGVRPKCATVPVPVPPTLGITQMCTNFAWEGTITPEGPISFSRNGDALHVEMPLRVDGRAIIAGDLPKVLPTNAEAFQARLAPGADIRFDVDANWCPVLQATPTQRWVTSASVEVVPRTCTMLNLGPLGQKPLCAGPANIDLTGAANARIAAAQADILKAVQTALNCDKVRNQLEAVWRSNAIPVGDAAGPKTWLNLTPTGAALSRLIVEQNQVRIVAQMSVRTALSQSPGPQTPVPLPTLRRATLPEGGLDLEIRAGVPFTVLKSTLNTAIDGKSFAEHSLAGDAEVRIDEADIYPSEGHVAVGLKVSARFPGKLLDGSGWVWLRGRPVIEPDGKSLRIEDLDYAVGLDNPVVRLVLATFRGPILATLKQHATFDLTDSITAAATQISSGINGTSLSGVSLSAERPTITLKGVSLSADSVVANARIQVPLSISLAKGVAQP